MTNKIQTLYLSQDDLLKARCFDMRMAISTAEAAMLAFQQKKIFSPDDIVQIFYKNIKDQINRLPASLLSEKKAGVKWVSLFPNKAAKYEFQNISPIMILSEIEKGFPLAFMVGTLCSNMRVAAVNAIAARHFARKDSKSIAFIGTDEQAKMNLIAMKMIIPSIKECRLSAKYEYEKPQFIQEMSAIFPDINFTATYTKAAVEDADIIVTATNTQAPILKAAWMKPGVFYIHLGGWEDEYNVAKQCDKIVCDDWENVKHSTQTLSLMYKDGTLTDSDIHANLVEVLTGEKSGRETDKERIYFNAVGLAYADVGIAHAMYQRAKQAEVGEKLNIQESSIFQHEELKNWIQM